MIPRVLVSTEGREGAPAGKSFRTGNDVSWPGIGATGVPYRRPMGVLILGWYMVGWYMVGGLLVSMEMITIETDGL